MSTETNEVIFQGLEDIRHESTNPSGKLLWFCAPDSWKPSSGREGRDGSWKLVEGKEKESLLVIYPPAKKDFWKKTYYEPCLIKDDGPVLYYSDLLTTQHYTVSAKFSLTAVCQFDQAGLFIRLDQDHWIKTGIEVVDGLPRLSCVVTNVYSDWSTQSWPYYQQNDSSKDGSSSGLPLVYVDNVEIRIHCRGTSFVVECKMPGSEGNAEKWEFIRIAHMEAASKNSDKGDDDEDGDKNENKPNKGNFWAGIFACCPEDQRGGFATFYSFEIQKGSHMEHNADGNQDTST